MLTQKAMDFIYSLEAMNEVEVRYAQEEIDFPFGKWESHHHNDNWGGNDEKDIVNHGMLDQMRFYTVGDRPFFEDVSSKSSVLYLIHNLMTKEECE